MCHKEKKKQTRKKLNKQKFKESKASLKVPFECRTESIFAPALITKLFAYQNKKITNVQ